MRGKAIEAVTKYGATGITPACAGKRRLHRRHHHNGKDHPRMCGEKDSCEVAQNGQKGSPPHVRGKVVELFPLLVHHGITPACAGKRPRSAGSATAARDHPRMCGEKNVDIRYAYQIPGSPPHVRGKDTAGGQRWYALRDHPRMCGEKLMRLFVAKSRRGSPPHVRGKAVFGFTVFLYARITPACAGKREDKYKGLRGS